MSVTYLTRLPDGQLAARTTKDPGRWVFVLAELQDDTYQLLWEPSRKAADADAADHPDAEVLPVVELPYGRQRAVRTFLQLQQLVEAHLADRAPAKAPGKAQARNGTAPAPQTEPGPRQKCTGACGRLLPMTRFPTRASGRRGTECRGCRDARLRAGKPQA